MGLSLFASSPGNLNTTRQAAAFFNETDSVTRKT